MEQQQKMVRVSLEVGSGTAPKIFPRISHLSVSESTLKSSSESIAP